MIKSKPIIGILATSNYNKTNDTFQDTYRYGNNYIAKIVENGGIPLLIPLYNDEPIYETLSLCDGLILPGGNRILKSNLEILDYFFKNNKPILGICLGMQTIAAYSVQLDGENSDGLIKPIDTEYNHWPIELTRENNNATAHKDYILENTIAYEIFQNKEITVNSVHKYTPSKIGKRFIASITSEDGLIEGIEYKDSSHFILGTQFHPEVLPQFNKIFEVFIQKCQ